MIASLPSGSPWSGLTRQDIGLLLAGMLVYSLSRFIGLSEFPIYFFCDEAIQPVLAEKLLRNGFVDEHGTFLPPYFRNVAKWSLSLSVYIHLVSVVLFGKSVVVTRATSVVVSMLAPLAIALTLKLVFRNRSWWLAPLVMAAMPAWFLHSRTAFETVMMVAFYACFLCAYLLYRFWSPRFALVAAVAGAATFYSYTNGQSVIVLSGVLLLLSDLRFHMRQFRTHPLPMVGTVVLFGLLAVPFIRFQLLQPGASEYHLQSIVGSYIFKPLPLAEKLERFRQTYLFALDPRYWFVYNYQEADLIRHLFKGRGHLLLVTAPFLFIGIGVCLWYWRSSAHRAVLIAVLVSPFSASLADIEIYRVLAMVVPATLLTLIGFDALLNRVAPGMPDRGGLPEPPDRKWHAGFRTASMGIAAVGLTWTTATMLVNALNEGPRWYTDYSITGMQYGAQQLFGEVIPTLLEDLPRGTHIVVSLNWVNNPYALGEFFLNDDQFRRVGFVNVQQDILDAQHRMLPGELFLLTSQEYAQVVESEKLVVETPEVVIPYPNNEPGLYVVRMRYVDNIEAIFAAEREEQRKLVETTVTLDGEPVRVRHSRLDMGSVADIFDGNVETPMRGAAANPLVVEFHFPSPRTITAFDIMIRCGWNVAMKTIVTPADGRETRTYEQIYHDLPLDPRLEYVFPEPLPEVQVLRIELTNLNGREVEHNHIWELEFRNRSEGSLRGESFSNSLAGWGVLRHYLSNKRLCYGYTLCPCACGARPGLWLCGVLLLRSSNKTPHSQLFRGMQPPQSWLQAGRI